MEPSFSPHPFWDFSLAVYKRPGVADACLFLQDRYGVDVNVLLFCVWVGASGRGRLGTPDIDNCVRRTGDWRERVIGPLRAIRRDCRDAPLGVPEFLLETFRPLMLQIELDAEHVEQLVLAETVRDRPAATVAAVVSADDARRNLQAYVATLGIEPDAGFDGCIAAVLAGAFPGGNPAPA